MKRMLSIILVLLLFAAFTACGAPAPAATDSPVRESAPQPAKSPAQPAGWSVAVEGAAKAAFTQEDYAALAEVTIEATKKKKDGSAQVNRYTGVLISEALKSLGVESFSKITLTAADGFEAELTPDMLGDKAIFATKVDGEDMESGEAPTAVLDGQPSNTWVKGFVKLTVTK